MFSTSLKLKRLFMLLLICSSIIIIQCGDSLSVKEGDKIDLSEGILFTNIKYMEGYPTFLTLILTVESLDRSTSFRITIDANRSKQILYRLKAGHYYFAEVQAEYDVEGSPSTQAAGKSTNYFGNVYENLFKIEAGKINYIGDILIQTRREHIGNVFKLTHGENRSQSEQMYFFVSPLQSKIRNLKKKYPKLAAQYKIKKNKILFGRDSTAAKEILDSKENIYGYGAETYGIDTRGYDNYKWGMTFDEVKLILNQEKRKYRLIKKNLLVDRTNRTKIIRFYFSNLPIVLWKNRLYKITLHYKTASKSILKQIKQKYGNPQKKGRKWVWEIPSTILILKSNGKKKSTLSYLSKDHINIVKLRKKQAAHFTLNKHF